MEWEGLYDLKPFKPESRADVLKIQEEFHISQFLMNVQLEFESVRSALLNREFSPDLKPCVQEVLREETKAYSGTQLENPTLLTSEGNRV